MNLKVSCRGDKQFGFSHERHLLRQNKIQAIGKRKLVVDEEKNSKDLITGKSVLNKLWMVSRVGQLYGFTNQKLNAKMMLFFLLIRIHGTKPSQTVIAVFSNL